jgi:hypothetical protein
MVFLSRSPFGGDKDGLPSHGYGFDFRDDCKPNKGECITEDSTGHVRLEDEEIVLPANGREVAHRLNYRCLSHEQDITF